MPPRKKTLLPDILIFQRFFKSAIAKRECVILARYPWHRFAARLDPSEVAEGLGDSPLKMFVAFLGQENVSFGCSIFLTIPTTGVSSYGCA